LERFEKIFIIFIALAFAFSLLAILAQIKTPSVENKEVSFKFSEPAMLGGQQIWLEKAETDKERIKGLSGQKGLAPNQGLLFVFPTPGLYSIWMKDMLFPIDVFWLNENLAVIHIEERLTPESFPQGFVSAEPASFVLEMIAGSAERLGIELGESLELVEE